VALRTVSCTTASPTQPLLTSAQKPFNKLFPAVAQITAKLSNLAALNPLMPTLKLHSNVLLYSNTVIATLAVDYYYYYYYYKRKD